MELASNDSHARRLCAPVVYVPAAALKQQLRNEAAYKFNDDAGKVVPDVHPVLMALFWLFVQEGIACTGACAGFSRLFNPAIPRYDLGTMTNDAEPTIANLFPELSASERAQAEKHLGRFAEVVCRVVRRHSSYAGATQQNTDLTAPRNGASIPLAENPPPNP